MWTVPRVPALHSSLIMASFSILLGGAAIAFSAYSVRRPFLMARRWVSLDIRRVAGNSFMARGKPLKVGEELNVNLYAWQRPLPPRPPHIHNVVNCVWFSCYRLLLALHYLTHCVGRFNSC